MVFVKLVEVWVFVGGYERIVDDSCSEGLVPLPTDVTVHLGAGYGYRPCREALDNEE